MDFPKTHEHTTAAIHMKSFRKYKMLNIMLSEYTNNSTFKMQLKKMTVTMLMVDLVIF